MFAGDLEGGVPPFDAAADPVRRDRRCQDGRRFADLVKQIIRREYDRQNIGAAWLTTPKPIAEQQEVSIIAASGQLIVSVIGSLSAMESRAPPGVRI
jgi:hypothetical protein